MDPFPRRDLLLKSYFTKTKKSKLRERLRWILQVEKLNYQTSMLTRTDVEKGDREAFDFKPRTRRKHSTTGGKVDGRN